MIKRISQKQIKNQILEIIKKEKIVSVTCDFKLEEVFIDSQFRRKSTGSIITIETSS